MAVDVACEKCGVHFKALPYRLKKGQSRFCSIKCSSGRSPAPDFIGPRIDWAQARECGSPSFNGMSCKRGHEGLRSTYDGKCVRCHREHTRRLYEDTEYKQKQYEKSKIWRENNKEFMKIYNKEYHKNTRTPEKLAKIRQYWHNMTDEQRKEYNRKKEERRKQDPEPKRAKTRERRTIRRGAEGKHSAADIREILERQKFKCAECKISIRKIRHIDHIVPLARGGTNWPSNLQGLCPTCNVRKGCIDPIEFAQMNWRLL